jgi:hypothetical protein
MNEEVRWKQRFANYQKALQQQTKIIEKSESSEQGRQNERPKQKIQKENRKSS